jgi:hypothetical protein
VKRRAEPKGFRMLSSIHTSQGTVFTDGRTIARVRREDKEAVTILRMDRI